MEHTYQDTSYSPTDRRVKFAFTQGDCWMLAQHMASVTGLEAVVIGEHDGIGDDIYEQFDWHHAFILDSQTRLCYDVDGVCSVEEMFDRYAEGDDQNPTEIRPAHPNHFVTNHHMFDISVQEGQRVMELTLERQGSSLPHVLTSTC